MDTKECVTNIIVAMINNNCIGTVEQVSEAYKTIFKTVYKPLDC